MRRLADGERAAFRPVFDAVLPPVRALCRRLLADGDAEDAAQEALMKLFKQAGRYDGESDPIAWALAIAGWECRTLIKKHSRRRETAEDDERGDARPTPEDAVMERELLDVAAEAIGSLRARDRETLGLALGDAPPSGPTFRKRRQRALARLRAVVRGRYG